jgi:tetratricopeptide (TPR) repeat protein
MRSINNYKIYVTPIVLLLSSIAYGLFYYTSTTKTIVQKKAIAAFLQPSKTTLNNLNKEISFWQQKLNNNADNIIAKSQIAKLYTERFSVMGNILDVHKADSLYKLVNTVNKYSTSSTYRALASNCITQHKFKQAKLYIDSALVLGDEKYASKLLAFDIELELGNTNQAANIIKTLAPKKFEVLIRLAKLKDHEGHLEDAISDMEIALDKVKEMNNTALYCWTMSNLGDMYSHNSEFTKSYNSYIEVLKIDNSYYHCLKGIAWLAFSHDNNMPLAKEILHFVNKQHPIPDYTLMLAEIAKFENNQKEYVAYLNQYTLQTSNTMYGDMYNKYNFYVLSNELNNVNKAMQIAETEVANRPTADSYNLLSWAYFKKGDIKKAQQIAAQFVEGRSFEPDVIVHLAIIYKAAGNTKKAKKYYTSFLESHFELGPNKFNQSKIIYNNI